MLNKLGVGISGCDVTGSGGRLCPPCSQRLSLYQLHREGPCSSSLLLAGVAETGAACCGQHSHCQRLHPIVCMVLISMVAKVHAQGVDGQQGLLWVQTTCCRRGEPSR